ncbi:MAG: molybdopterin molybdotransferase MoeA, partial [Actinomycetaceae bacterium]|nr:molybdopterin molybdotransferase MoeA [Actinomycetaceae bacterium]
MISVEEYFLEVTKGVEPLPAVELPLEETTGCTLAEPLKAKLAVPPFTNSAMDGFAVRAEDLKGATPESGVTLPVRADIAAGTALDSAHEAGYATRIMTGAPVPEGADTVVKVEDTNIEPGPRDLPAEVTIYKEVRAGANVRYAGENAKVGEEIIKKGVTITAPVVASAASIGYGTIPVIPKPRVAVISTGAELRAPGEPIEPGQIPDSNSIMLASLAESFGAEVVYRGNSGDTPEQLLEVLREAAAVSDLVITSGGVSAGAFDPIKMIGDKAGLSFRQVRMQPGKPQGHGLIDVDGRQVKLVSLPGNPVSVFVSFILFVRPIISLMAGRGNASLELLPAIAGSDWKSSKGRRQYAPVIATLGERNITVRPVQGKSSPSHLVATLHR